MYPHTKTHNLIPIIHVNLHKSKQTSIYTSTYLPLYMCPPGQMSLHLYIHTPKKTLICTHTKIYMCTHNHIHIYTHNIHIYHRIQLYTRPETPTHTCPQFFIPNNNASEPIVVILLSIIDSPIIQACFGNANT